ncbi:MAG: hypothetical protein Q9M40_07295 [Sulfurimonas sp.]|nr:hypothetical protein [Sulfurimonas sp.]
MDKKEAIMVTMVMYYLCFKLEKGTKKVDKFIKQIRHGLSKLDKELHTHCNNIAYDAWNQTKKNDIGDDEVYEVSVGEIITALHNSLGSNPYKYIFFTERTLISAINSLDGCIEEKALDEITYLQHSRNLANAFIKNIGIKKRYTPE